MPNLQLGVGISLHDDVSDVNIVGLVGVDICSTDDLKKIENDLVISIFNGVRMIKQ
jgi:hypothetical protein